MSAPFPRRIFVSVCLLALAGCGGGSQSVPTPTLTAGIQGQATKSPISPVSQAGQANSAPLPGAIIIVKKQLGAEVVRQTSDSQGNFKIGLQPGTYLVVGQAPVGTQNFPIPPGPQSVTVVAGLYTTVSMDYDTGIR